MSQTHFSQRQLPQHGEVWIMPAVRPSGKVIVFVHGYGGNAIETWSEFPQMLQDRGDESGHDLIFYGYDGLRAELVASAAILRDFLQQLFTATTSVLNAGLPASARREPEFAFEKMVVVAHSLGAVIARWALLDATKTGAPWPQKTELVLFAPAHTGAEIAKLADEVVASFPFLKLFSIAARFQSPLIDQLKKGSDELRLLKEQTVEATADGRNAHLIARKVFIAPYDKIVSNLAFLPVESPVAILNATHTSICKPHAGFLQPLESLLEWL